MGAPGGCMREMNEYQKQAGRTAPPPAGSNRGLMSHAPGLVGEAGEVAEAVKKHLFHGHDRDREAVAKELGDVLWYVARMAAAVGVDLSSVAERNISKFR